MGNSSQLCPRLQLLIDSLPCFTTLLQGYLPLQSKGTHDLQGSLSVLSVILTLGAVLKHGNMDFPHGFVQ
jgi:hypothetical protein